MNHGVEAEKRVADYLRSQRFTVLEQNWKTRWSEIDIVARKGSCIHCVEVKYRRYPNQGDGFDYITFDKRRRLVRGASAWCAQRNWHGDIQIDVAAVSGDDFRIDYRENAVEV